MFGARGLARISMAGIFLVGARASWKHAQHVAPKVEPLAGQLFDATGVKVSGESLVKVNAGVQIGAATLFALGFQQRLMALTLIGSLLPTTYVGHPFWEIDDEGEKMTQKLNFLKNAAMIGGLAFAALDTGGRPSIFWTGRKAAEGIAGTVAATAHTVSDSVRDAVDR
jgi:putative oxidoreductase